MFQRISRVVTEDHARHIASKVGPRDLFEPAIRPLITTVMGVVGVCINYPAYCVVERKPEGHDWHTDKGNRDHMEWCRYSASVGLSPPSDYTGGCFYTRDEPHQHYLDMLLYSSDVEHRVDPHEGDRRVLLMFFG